MWIIVTKVHMKTCIILNPLKAELNPICHLLALIGAHHILHVSGLRINGYRDRAVKIFKYESTVNSNKRQLTVNFNFDFNLMFNRNICYAEIRDLW